MSTPVPSAEAQGVATQPAPARRRSARPKDWPIAGLAAAAAEAVTGTDEPARSAPVATLTAEAPAPVAVSPAPAKTAAGKKVAGRKTAGTKGADQPTSPAANPRPAPAAKPKPAKVDKTEKTEKTEKAEKADKVAKVEKLEKTDKPAPAAAPKAKLVRDSFTMPSADFDLIDVLKDRALGFRRPTKKSELLRAGLQALAALPAAELKAVLGRLTPLKTGRPKKNG